jgi:hypothetical protein
MPPMKQQFLAGVPLGVLPRDPPQRLLVGDLAALDGLFSLAGQQRCFAELRPAGRPVRRVCLPVPFSADIRQRPPRPGQPVVPVPPAGFRQCPRCCRPVAAGQVEQLILGECPNVERGSVGNGHGEAPQDSSW